MPFDKEQQQAIETTGTNILVSASAGAGKTGVLVERLTKRVVKDHIRVSRILAMTFTQAAAAEMKKRLASRLHDEFQKTDDPTEKEYLNSQLIELESANITTIDSYCLTIIRKYFPVIGLDPAIATNILDEGTGNLLKRQAFQEVFAEMTEENQDQMLQLSEYFSARSEDYTSLREMVEAINLQAQAGMDPTHWYQDAKDSYHPIQRLNDLPEEILQNFYQSFLLKIETMDCLLDQMFDASLKDEKIEATYLAEEKNLLTNCRNYLNEHHWNMFCNTVDTLYMHYTFAGGKNLPYKTAREEYNKKKKELLLERFPEDILVQDHNELNPICRTLVTLAQRTWERFGRIKKENACMDFSDMERYAYEILNANHGTTAAILRESLDEIMVDEFQDTSELQNAIIDCIAKPNNVFRVGDVKQSIYRFRQAKPQLMRSLMNDPNTYQITLRHNYRSKDSIVRFTNILFQKIMNIPGCLDSYTDLDTVSIGENNPRQQEDHLRPVIYAKIPVSKKDDIRADAELGLDTKKDKAEWICSEMLRILKNEEDVHFRDFCILVRSHADKAYLRSAFERFHIPYAMDGREGFYHSELCQTIQSLVSLMLDTNNNLSLLSVVTSPLYHICDEELANLRIQYQSVTKGIYIAHPEILEDIHHFRTIAEEKGILDMLQEVANHNHFYQRLDERSRANFDFLFEKMSSTNVDSLYQFLDSMQAGEDEKSSEAMAHGKDDDAVTVTTIHQSKGLQYRIVFLWGTSQYRFNDGASQLMIHDSLKLGLKHLTLPMRASRPTARRIAIEYRTNIEDLEEFTRLLYVAVTRAEERMYLVDAEKKPFPDRPLDLSFLNARTGITGLIETAMRRESLFDIHDITNIDREKAQPLPARWADELPILHAFQRTLVPIDSPSSFENTPIPDLNFNDFGTDYGTRTHAILEELPNTIWTRDDLEPYGLKDTEIDRILAFAHSSLYAKALTMEIHKEYPFYVEQKESAINGIMDFIALSEKEVLIIDFKTDRASNEQIRKRYSDQLNAYRKAAQILYSEHTITVYAWSFHNSSEIQIEPNTF